MLGPLEVTPYIVRFPREPNLLTDAGYVPRTSENPPIARDINDEAENSVIAPAVMILPIRVPAFFSEPVETRA
jgi:hypothetical protein